MEMEPRLELEIKGNQNPKTKNEKQRADLNVNHEFAEQPHRGAEGGDVPHGLEGLQSHRDNQISRDNMSIALVRLALKSEYRHFSRC